MRTIKFRGKNDDDKWVELTLDEILSEEGSSYYMFFHKPYRQYTGLKDKNDKEIYEGDIIKANFDDIKYKEIKEFNSEVMFGYGQFYVCNNSIVYPVFDIFAHVEVIGNIYENHELLED